MTTYTPSCIACGARLTESAVPSDVSRIPQPYAATLFTSDGNYGSTVWDPQANGRLQLMIWVCDPCMVVQGLEGTIMLIRELPQAPVLSLAKWRAHEDAEPLGEV